MSDVFVGRQPLLDRRGTTIGYELLYRSASTDRTAHVVDGEAATAGVLSNSLTEIGLDRLVGNKLAFFNLTDRYLADPSILEHLPADRVVLEVLENIEPTPEVIEGLKRLRQLGYRVALDDFVDGGPTTALAEFATIIKYDYTQITAAELRERVAIDHAASRTVVVERIETHAEFAEAAECGVDWFQGFYFARPETISAKTIAPNSLSLAQLLAQINRPEATMSDIVEVLSHDVSMSLKVLRYVNTAAFAKHTSVASIQSAAVMVGLSRLRSWTALALLSSIDNKPTELVTIALTRAKFCEDVAHERQLDGPEAFYTVGMLSLLEAMTDTPMADVTSQIAISDEIRSALVGDDGELSGTLGEAIRVEQATSDGTLDAIESATLRRYQRAMLWATEIVTAAS